MHYGLPLQVRCETAAEIRSVIECSDVIVCRK